MAQLYMVCRSTYPSIYALPFCLTCMIPGIVVALFFQCTAALTNPVNTTRKSVKLGLVAHATALFLFLTTRIVVNQYTVSTDYIDNRGFPGTDKVPPGPTGYNSIHFTSGPFLNVYSVIFPLSQWLADGLFVSPTF